MTSLLKSTKQLLRNTLKEELRHVLYMILKVKMLNLKLLLAKRKRATEERPNKTKQVRTSTMRKMQKKENLKKVQICQSDQNLSINRL